MCHCTPKFGLKWQILLYIYFYQRCNFVFLKLKNKLSQCQASHVYTWVPFPLCPSVIYGRSVLIHPPILTAVP